VQDPNQPGKACLQSSLATFLGYKVSAEGSRPLEEPVAHLQDCHPPKTTSQLCRSLGMHNFYRRFLPQAAATQTPLHDVLSDPRIKGSHPIAWTPELQKAFEECTAILSRPTTGTPSRATFLGYGVPSEGSRLLDERLAHL
jgi:hypothetical protein